MVCRQYQPYTIRIGSRCPNQTRRQPRERERGINSRSIHDQGRYAKKAEEKIRVNVVAVVSGHPLLRYYCGGKENRIHLYFKVERRERQ
jgi:hypothetical protein